MSKPYCHLWRDMTAFENLLSAYHMAVRDKHFALDRASFMFAREIKLCTESALPKHWPLHLLPVHQKRARLLPVHV